MWYWSVAILFWQLSIDNIVNVQCKRCGFTKTRLRHPSLHFDSLPYPTRTICRRVRTYVSSVNHVTSKQKELDHILWVWEPCYKSPIAFGETPISEVGLIMDVSFFFYIVYGICVLFRFLTVKAFIFCQIYRWIQTQNQLVLSPPMDQSERMSVCRTSYIDQRLNPSESCKTFLAFF